MKTIIRQFNSMEHALVGALVVLMGVSGFSLLHAFSAPTSPLGTAARIVLPN